ncbi:MAG: rRNA maturation RNase YbeY [Aureibaculum sp.]
MIGFNFETEYSLQKQNELGKWITDLILKEGLKEGDINYIFCNDDYLLEKNVKYLNHNELTDIITFDYSIGKLLSGDIFISIERVKDNAISYNVAVKDELQRVMVHGVLHLCGYKDKSKEEKSLMRDKEDYYLSLRTF